MRHITLLLEDGTIEDVNKIKNFCKENEIEFKYRYSRNKNNHFENFNENDVAPLYYFSIIGNTKNYEELKEIMGDKITTTDFADICNIADMDDSFEQGLKNVLDLMKVQTNAEHKANREFLDFIMPIKDVKTLKALNDYSCYMSDFQKKMLQDRIDICNGEREKVDEEFTSNILSLHCDVKALREKTRMNRREFSNYFGIPYRTVEDWENKKSTCAKYLYNLMENALIKERKIKE